MLTLDEAQNTFPVLLCGLFADQVDFILKNDNVLQLHDLNSGKMFGGLRLRAWFIASDKQQSGVHYGSTVQHSSHENVVTRAYTAAGTCRGCEVKSIKASFAKD